MFEEPQGESRRYREYELPLTDRESIREIKRCLDKGYTDQRTLRNHLNCIEELLSRIRDILRAEESFGYSNETLKHDFRTISSLAQQLTQELDRIDQ